MIAASSLVLPASAVSSKTDLWFGTPEIEALPKQGAAAAFAKRARMSDAEIRIRANGPYVLRGCFILRDADGNEIDAIRKNDTVALCRCGASERKPFCDRSHVRAEFADPGVSRPARE